MSGAQGRLSWLKSPAVLVGLAGLLATVAVAHFVLGHAYSLYDDAYIYFRYVESTFAGCPLRYSCGDERVEGFTSPLYLALLHGLRVLSPDLPTLSQLLNAGLLVATLILAVDLARRLAGGPAGFAAGMGTLAVLALDHYTLLNSVVGLETALAAMFVTALAHRRATGGHGQGAILVLATLARPECAVLVLLWPVVDRPFAWRQLLWPFVALALVAAARYALFEDVVPNTARAKAGGTAAHFRLGAAYLLDAAVEFPVLWLAPLALLSGVLSKRRASAPTDAGEDRQARANTVARLLLPGTALVALSCLRTGGDTFDYSRFLFPFVPVSTALALGAIAALPRGAWLAAATALILAGRATTAHTIPAQHGFDNVLRYGELGAYLGRTLPGATIATGAIGAVAYTSGNPILDLLGLVDRHIARTGTTVPPERLTKAEIGHERHDADYVLARRPEVIATIMWQRTPFRRGAALDVRLHAEWELVARLRSAPGTYVPFTPEVAPGVHWLLFLRRDVAAELLSRVAPSAGAGPAGASPQDGQ